MGILSSVSLNLQSLFCHKMDFSFSVISLAGVTHRLETTESSQMTPLFPRDTFLLPGNGTWTESCGQGYTPLPPFWPLEIWKAKLLFVGETRKAKAILSTHYDVIFWKIQGRHWQSIAEQVCCAVRVTSWLISWSVVAFTLRTWLSLCLWLTVLLGYASNRLQSGKLALPWNEYKEI